MATGRIGATPVLTTRWSKAPAAGTTSLSGLDDNSVSLVYSVGYEAVYQNGVLLSRGNDYTATNGTTITLTTATVAGDIIEVFANQTIPLTDTYSQTVANSLFVNQATFDAKGDLIVGTADNAYSRLAVGSNNQVLTADSSTSTGLKWATPASGGKVLQVVNAIYSTQTDTTSASASDLFSASITPAATTSKILVLANLAGCAFLTSGTNDWGEGQMLRNNGVASWKIADRIAQGMFTTGGTQTVGGFTCFTARLDEPASTSAVTYKMQILRGNGTGTFRVNSNNAVSSITLIEIGA